MSDGSGAAPWWATVICTVITTIGVIASTAIANHKAGETVDALVGAPGQKLCSVAVKGWRDTITVPQSWTRDTCSQFRRAVAPNADNSLVVSIGCAFADNVRLVDLKDHLDPDCGWDKKQ